MYYCCIPTYYNKNYIYVHLLDKPIVQKYKKQNSPLHFLVILKNQRLT